MADPLRQLLVSGDGLGRGLKATDMALYLKSILVWGKANSLLRKKISFSNGVKSSFYSWCECPRLMELAKDKAVSFKSLA